MASNDPPVPNRRAREAKPQTPTSTPDLAKTETLTTDTPAALVQRAQHNSTALNPRDVQQLQRTVGNRAVTQLLHTSAAKGARPTPSSTGSDPSHCDVQSTMEQQMGADFSGVTLHTESFAAQDLNALAYTQGDNVHFAPGQFQPDSTGGRALLGHELAHVVQQRQGQVQATRQLKGQALNDDSTLEQAADDVGQRVAAAPVASATPTQKPWRIVQPGGAGGRAPIQRKGPADTAKARGITLDARPMPTANGIVRGSAMDPAKNKGKSMAASPDYEKEAEAFERRLGIAAFNDARALAAVVAMCSKIEAYIEAKVGAVAEKTKDWEATMKAAGDIYKKLAGDKDGFKYFGGSVGNALKSGTDEALEANLNEISSAIDGVFGNGNVRERLNLIDRFMEDILDPDFKNANDPTKWAEFTAMLTEAKINLEVFEQKNALPKRALFDQNVDVSVKKPNAAPVTEARDQIRMPSNKGASDTFTDLTARDLRETPLSDREKDHQKSMSPDYASGFNVPLKFTEGARYFLINEESAWVQKMRSLSVPMKAGPSGHTAIFFEANKLLGAGADPHALRLAAIGHLLPIRAHSLIEIVEVASRFGADPAQFPGFYQGIKPYSQGELRAIGGGRFPGETVETAAKAKQAEDLLAEAPVLAPVVVPDADELAVAAARRKRMEEVETVKSMGTVNKVLESDEGAAMEQTLSQPHLTSNARDALKLAAAVAAAKRAEDKAAVEERLRKAGIDLAAKPTAYDDCVTYLRNKGLTINIGTNLLEFIFNQPAYKNIWTLHFTNSDSNYVAGRDLTERTLHDLPSFDPASGEGSVRRQGQKEVARDLLHKPLGLPNMEEQDDAATSGTNLKKHLPEASIEDEPDMEDEGWADWYYRTRDDKRGSGNLVDRPISSALNFTDYRGGGAIAYGSTHLKLKDSVKSRATLTGQDSKDLIYQKGLGAEAVGTFEEMGPVLRYMEENAFNRLVKTAVLKQAHAPKGGMEMGIGYIEAQIFGGLDLTKDLEKIVIDLDDLDLWVAGKLLIDPLVATGYRPAKNVEPIKRAVEAFATQHKIPLQYVRSGKGVSPNAHESNKPMHRFAETAPWEKDAEAALRAFGGKSWKAAQDVSAGVARGAAKASGGMFGPSVKTMGLDAIAAVTTEIAKLRKDAAKPRLLPQAKTLLAGSLSTLAERLLDAYYHFPPKETNRAELERLVRNAVNDLATATPLLIDEPAIGGSVAEPPK